MAISTYKTFLMYRSIGASAWQKLICVKDIPDLGGDPEMLDATTLCDATRVNIKGIQDMDSLQFTCNYDADAFQRIKNLEDEELEFAVWFGGEGSGDNLVPTGSEGVFSWRGKLSIWVNGGGVNEVVEMTISIASSTEINFSRNGGDTAGIKLNASVISVAKDGTGTLVATTTPSGETVTWSSLDTDVATVSNGTVSGEDTGSTTIIASISVGGDTFYDTCIVNVTAG